MTKQMGYYEALVRLTGVNFTDDQANAILEVANAINAEYEIEKHAIIAKPDGCNPGKYGGDPDDGPMRTPEPTAQEALDHLRNTVIEQANGFVNRLIEMLESFILGKQ